MQSTNFFFFFFKIHFLQYSILRKLCFFFPISRVIRLANAASVLRIYFIRGHFQSKSEFMFLFVVGAHKQTPTAAAEENEIAKYEIYDAYKCIGERSRKEIQFEILINVV